jgi:hypothetical protein
MAKMLVGNPTEVHTPDSQVPEWQLSWGGRLYSLGAKGMSLETLQRRVVEMWFSKEELTAVEQLIVLDVLEEIYEEWSSTQRE